MKNFFAKIFRLYKLGGLYILKFITQFYPIIAIVGVTAVGLIARYAFVTYPTNDMAGYVLNRWMGGIDEAGFSDFYKIDSDYSPLYLFALAILSLLPKGELLKLVENGRTYEFFANRMVYVKTMYYLFTIALAVGVYLIVKELTGSENKALVGYIAAFVLPTVFVNSAIWGNADVVYATFLIYSFYFALKDKSILCFIFFGLSFANKAQAIFILPFLIYLVFSRKLKLWPVIFAPIVYFVSVLPAIFCGATLNEAFAYLSKQFSGQANVNYGCANVWKFLELGGGPGIFRDNAVYLAILAVGTVLAVIYMRNVDLEKRENLFKVGFTLVMTTIFFLPRLHERYFYVIDVLAIVYALVDKKKFYFVPLMQLSSGIAYFHYLTGHYFIDAIGENSVTIAACINLFILCVSFLEIFKLDHGSMTLAAQNYDEEIKKIKEGE